MAPPLSQDRLVRKEVALGVIREYEPPQDQVGLRLFAPFLEVQSDDVIFSYTRGMTAGLAPARAEDAESELAGKDDSVGSGRASIIDWAMKDHYDASDITRYREGLIIGGLAGAEQLQLTTRSMTEDFANKIARDTMLRRRRLDNRLEWLIMQALDLGQITYDDGKIKFVVNYGRPAPQQDMAPPSGSGLWSNTNSDPIEDLLLIKQAARDNFGITQLRAVMSTRVWRNLRKNTKFTNSWTSSNPLYQVVGWGDQAALEFISAQTDIQFTIYDSVYRTRALGSNTTVNNKFMRDDVVLITPGDNDIAALDDAIGFGRTLTSPHPEGNWAPGFYEWERETVDPWGRDMGTGIKAFPVFPHLDKTWVLKVL